MGIVNTDGKQGAEVAPLELGAKGAGRAGARKTPGSAKARLARWPAGGAQGSSQTTLERARERSGGRSRSAVAELLERERRRVAADVHDLILQDLALALASARTLADDPAQAVRASIVVAACERAVAAAHDMVEDLLANETRPVVDAVGASVRAAARLVPLRFDAEGVPVGRQPDQPTLDAIVHIAREAVANAVKHAAPSAVEVVLEHREGWRLLVRDDGCGFDPASAHAGFGLDSMSAHARALGGTLRVASAVGAGTTVEAVLA